VRGLTGRFIPEKVSSFELAMVRSQTASLELFLNRLNIEQRFYEIEDNSFEFYPPLFRFLSKFVGPERPTRPSAFNKPYCALL
jgi:hypothetical protein